MKRKNDGYLIAVPDKKNPEIINYYHVKGPKFLYGKRIVEDFEDDEEILHNTEKNEDDEIKEEIAQEVKKILKQKSKKSKVVDEESETPKKSKDNNSRKKSKKNIKKPKNNKKTKNYRYTVPKERGIFSRIINRMMYESDDYNDIEDYLYDNYEYVYEDLEQSKKSKTRRGQRLYKRVQAYEDARDDITMKKAFIGMKTTAVAVLLAGAGLSVNLLAKQFDEILNSGYVAQESEKPKLSNANEGQIQYAENVLSKIDYEFEHLSHTEQLDTVIRSGSKVNDINENRARSAAKDFLNFSDQKLLEAILEDAYEGEYNSFSEEKKLELKQLLYEMLDEKAKFWIRSPERVAEIQAKNENKETAGMEIE